MIHFSDRKARNRDLNDNGTISAITEWDRTVSYSDIKRYLDCGASYLMWTECDKPGERHLSDRVGQIVHRETAKPEGARVKDIATILKDVPKEDRERVVSEVKAMIAATIAAEDAESKGASVTRKDDMVMVWHDAYTNTWWYAKPDKMDVIDDGRGRYLNIVDKKTGRMRKRWHLSSVFFFGYVARMSKVFDHTGPIRTVVRYMRDWNGNVLDKPDDSNSAWIGRRLTESQERELMGLQETIKRMSRDWAEGEFETKTGNHCDGCQFAASCPANRLRLERIAREEAEMQLDVESTVVPHVAPAAMQLPVINQAQVVA